jgi:serine/threonine protein kinase
MSPARKGQSNNKRTSSRAEEAGINADGTVVKRFNNKRQKMAHALIYLHSTSINQRFEFGDELGEGSYGCVFDCVRKDGSNKPVAIKILNKDEKKRTATPTISWSGLRRSAQREIELSGGLIHPNLISMQQALIDEAGKVYMVFDKADQSLFDLLESKGGSLSWAATKSVATNLVQGLQCLHSHQIAHRDLKPDNLLICRHNNGIDDCSFSVKIADLSLSRYMKTSDPLSVDGTMTPSASTRDYSAPELLLGADYGTEVDLWAAGCIIAECVCGAKVFPKASTDLEQLISIFHILGFPNTSDCANMWPQFKAYAHLFSFPCDCPEFSAHGKCEDKDCPFRHVSTENRSVCENWGMPSTVHASSATHHTLQHFCHDTPNPDCCPQPALQCTDAACSKRHPSTNCLNALVLARTAATHEIAVVSTQPTRQLVMNLITHMLMYNPNARLTAQAAVCMITDTSVDN